MATFQILKGGEMPEQQYEIPLSPGESVTLDLGLGRILLVESLEDGSIQATEVGSLDPHVRQQIIEGEEIGDL